VSASPCDLNDDWDMCDTVGDTGEENAANAKQSPAFDAIVEIMAHFIDGYRQIKFKQ